MSLPGAGFPTAHDVLGLQCCQRFKRRGVRPLIRRTGNIKSDCRRLAVILHQGKFRLGQLWESLEPASTVKRPLGSGSNFTRYTCVPVSRGQIKKSASILAGESQRRND
ncbi:hypothetical protein C0Q70_00646 [Pomacea canaliculata]|uniref:Uncharacterized protein n=1 Tax=Pomacea canaliculata TaxID=400727 RepID=A0A2T7PX80_POMCA|nr:hypothetical protein C0Q70_00646 [Pomacea canaliculata]